MRGGKGGDDGSQGKAMGKGMKESISRLFDQIRLLIVWGGLEILKPITPDKHRLAIMQAITRQWGSVEAQWLQPWEETRLQRF
jgi:hypothetical protein